MLSIEVTTKCNLDCIDCFARTKNPTSINFYSASQIVLEGYKLGYRRLSITGGEPFKYLQLIDLLKYATEIGYEGFLINTNGILLPDNIRFLKNYNIDLTITLDGFVGDNDKRRGIGSYKKTIRGIENGLENNLNIYIYTVVDKINLMTIPHFVDYMYKTYPKIKGLVLIQLRGGDENLSPEDFIALVKMTSSLNLLNYNVQILENSLATVAACKMSLKNFPHSPDITINDKIVVLSNGNITFNHSSKEILGNIKDTNLKEILESKQYKTVTQKVSKICQECNFNKLCADNKKIRPSCQEHNIGDNSKYFCQKVLSLI